jgi:hypothetical protein
MKIETLIKQLSIYPKNANIRLVIDGMSKEYGIIGIISPIHPDDIIHGSEFKIAVEQVTEIKISISDNGEITS